MDAESKGVVVYIASKKLLRLMETGGSGRITELISCRTSCIAYLFVIPQCIHTWLASPKVRLVDDIVVN